MNTKNKIKIDS